jgi:hypothetical protein
VEGTRLERLLQRSRSKKRSTDTAD